MEDYHHEPLLKMTKEMTDVVIPAVKVSHPQTPSRTKTSVTFVPKEIYTDFKKSHEVSGVSECPRKEDTLIISSILLSASYSCPRFYCVMSLYFMHNFLCRVTEVIRHVSQTSHSKTSTSRIYSLRKPRPPSSSSIAVSIMMPVMISMIMRSLMVSGQNCFGGIETFEKVSMTDFDENFTPAGILLQQTDQALTRDCVNLCKQQSSCLSFGLDYTKFRCAAYSINSVGRKADLVKTNATNFFEKVCYRGIARDEYEKICGIERLWSFERVMNAFLEGFEKIQLNNVASRSECAKACLMETTFTCRSADYDDQLRICRLSNEDRRTQPQAFRVITGSHREYLENQCAAPGESSLLFITFQLLRKLQTQDCKHQHSGLTHFIQTSFFGCHSYQE